MRPARYSYRQKALTGLQLLGLFAVSGLLSLFFPHWLPIATVNPIQREWASAWSAASLLACVISVRAFGTLTQTSVRNPMSSRTSAVARLKWASMGVDAAAFLWSTRACTDRDTMIVTVLMAVAYLGFPLALKRVSGGAKHADGDDDARIHTRIVAAAAAVGLACVLVSGAITEL